MRKSVLYISSKSILILHAIYLKVLTNVIPPPHRFNLTDHHKAKENNNKANEKSRKIEQQKAENTISTKNSKNI